MVEMSYRKAVSKALHEALLNDSSLYLFGEDVGGYGGSYAVTKGFLEEFGPERIIDTPISESAMVGLGTGAAMAGLRPVVEIMTINFTLLAMDQIVNHAAKLRYMSGGQYTAPIIIRTVTGGGAQLGATHSQSLEGWFASVPGLKVVVPSDPKDALGLFRAVMSEQDPVIFVEHLLLYSSKGEVPENDYVIPIGKAEVKKNGDDITIISYSRMVLVALEAAQKLTEMDISVEVVDLRSLAPLDIETVLKSVRKTGHALVVEEACRTGGFGAEVASQVQEFAFDYLDGPVIRVAGEDVPIPYSRPLEKMAIQTADSIIVAVKNILGR